MSDEELTDSDFDPVVADEEEQELKICNYCEGRKTLVENKPYCASCNSLKFRECRRCKKPYHLGMNLYIVLE